MNNIIYISILKEKSVLRRYLPMGDYWPEFWLTLAAHRLPLIEKQSELGRADWWYESPWTKKMAEHFSLASLRKKIIAKIGHEISFVALEQELLLLGGGEEAWQLDLQSAGFTLLTGKTLPVIAAMATIKKQEKKQVALWLGGKIPPIGLLDWLSHHLKLLVIFCNGDYLAQLELWQARAIYETGVVVKINQAFNMEQFNGVEVVLLYQEPTEDLFIYTNSFNLPFWNLEDCLSQCYIFLKSQPRRLQPAQAELLLCQEQPLYWHKLNNCNKDFNLTDIVKLWEELKKVGMSFGFP